MVQSRNAGDTETGFKQAIESHGVAVACAALGGRGLPLAPETDVERLVQVARRTLREKFATAEAGLSGVDFAVAETGTLVLAENEGSGRMCSTVPRLHIAVMGLDKIIPRLDDVPPLLSLLARSAAGRAIPAYVSLLSGPRRPGEKDGPAAVHLIVLDNAWPRPGAVSPWRKALSYLRQAGDGSEPPPPDQTPLRRPVGSDKDRLLRVRRGMESAGSEFLDARGGDWLAAVQRWLAANAIPGCIYAPATRLGRKIAEQWNVEAPLIPFGRPLAAWKDEFFAQAGAGITTTRGGIAETGSLIVWPDALEPRSLSLIPPVHVALLDCRRIYDTLEQAMGEQDWRNRMPADLLLLSGPSCTTDLGPAPVIGVHGPKRLLVVLVDGDPAA